ncbi:ATP-binding protein [Salinibaculum rarum]|uniref:ATP-binding protein n=1 Tax=Salinibaculum rarum TaxID=3058903 RepID=UPI00265FA157|nr:ATP-binding protein [Salinibaculum sp. KK48]
MTFVLGREAGVDAGPVGRLGAYRALDGSDGAPLYLDVDGPHAALVVGKRGYGKSYTLGVVAEFLARTPGVAPVIVDPMGVFAPMADAEDTDGPVPATVVAEPSVAPTALDPRSWCALLGLDPESGAGSLVWRAAQTGDRLPAMRQSIDDADAPTRDRRAAINHLSLAESWGVFDDEGLSAQDLAGHALTVVDVSGLDPAPMNAVVRGIGDVLYRMRVDETVERLPWLLVDEAHAFFDGVARAALERILTRGRAPGVSLVVATQRPSAIPPVAVSQSDILVAHRLTAQTDLDALARARPTYLTTALENQLPSVPGEVVVVDDATETVHTAQVRERQTPHGGDNPRVSDRSWADTLGAGR